MAKASKKAKQPKQPPAGVIRELRDSCSLYCLSIKYEKNPDNQKALNDLMEKRYFGDPSAGVASALDMLIDGSPPFDILYDVEDTETGKDRVLKTSATRDPDVRWVAGRNYDRELLSKSAFGTPLTPANTITGRSLTTRANGVLKNAKKALSLVPKTKDIVHLNSKLEVEGYQSGKNESNFFDKILDGMHQMLVEDGPGFEDGPDAVAEAAAAASAAEAASEVASAAAAAAASAEASAAPSAEAASAAASDISDDDGGGGSTSAAASTAAGEDADADLDEDVGIFGVGAPTGYWFTGWMAFVVFGPTSQYMTNLLKMNGDGKKVDSGRAAARRVQAEEEGRERNAGGAERGINLSTKVQLAGLAQNEDAASQRRVETDIAIISQLMASKQRRVENYMELVKKFDDEKKQDKFIDKIDVLNEEISKLEGDLEELHGREHPSNDIVSTVLEHAAMTIGVKRAREEGDEKEDS